MTEAELILRDFLESVLKERGSKQKEVRIKEINSDGANYTSLLFSVNVETFDKELKLFAKVADVADEARRVLNCDNLFCTEKFVYNQLIPLYNSLQKDLDEEHKFIFPEFYGFNNEFGKETVILENLVESGYKPYSRFKSMDWDHGRICVEAIARFHALSFALRKSDPEGFQKIAQNLKNTFDKDAFDQTTKDQFKDMAETALSVLKQEECRDKIRKLLFETDLMYKYNQPLSTPVLAHGDYKISNLLFKRKGHNLKAVVVDYQTVHTGCPVGDLLYFIFLGSDEHFRRLYYDKLINHYYTSLEEALKRLDVDPVEVYPRENFESDLKESLPFVIVTALSALPNVLADVETVQKWNSECGVEDFIKPKFSDLYIERFRGIINDFVRWNVI
ncbi:unnamed protein product [Danaus chrysippus]|uniref:(African queen) hypothetical protein n=1 Tax=Danaus chrysippus TaxID=151541 RepID=A0A8J2QR87_9NEOP|nr:unnamed protein product [Danaus chrysippus]